MRYHAEGLPVLLLQKALPEIHLYLRAKESSECQFRGSYSPELVEAKVSLGAQSATVAGTVEEFQTEDNTCPHNDSSITFLP